MLMFIKQIFKVSFFFFILLSAFGEEVNNSISNYLDNIFFLLKNTDPYLRQQFFKAKAYKYRAKQTLDEYKPQIYFQGYYGYDSYSVSNRNGNINTTLKYYNFYLKQPLLHLEIINKWKVDNFNYKSQYYKFLNTYQTEKNKIVKLLIDLIILHEQIKIIKQQSKLYDSLIQGIKILLNENRISFISYLETYKAAQDTKLLLVKKIAKFKAEKVLFKQLTGITPFLNFMPSYKLSIQNLTKTLKLINIADIDKNNKILEQKMNVLSSKYDIFYRKSKKFPTLDIVFSYTYTSSSSISIASKDKRIMLVLSFPLYAGGKYFDEIKEAKNIYTSNLNLLIATKLELKQDFMEKKTYCEKLIFVIEQDLNLINKSKYLLQTYQNQLTNNLINRLEYIKRKIMVYNYKLQFLRDLQEFLHSYIDLLTLTSNINARYLKLLDLLFKQKSN
jgi:outer membrane protein TolC